MLATWLGEPDPDGAEQPGSSLQDGKARVWHGQEAVDGEAEVGTQPRVITQGRYGPLLSPEHHGIQPPRVLSEHGRRGVGRGRQRLVSLFLAPAGEPLLRLAAGCAPPVHEATADLGGGKTRR